MGSYEKPFLISKQHVALEPFPQAEGPQTKIVAGFAVAQDKSSLVPLKVVIPSDFGHIVAQEGDVVYVTADTADTPFAKRVLDFEGKKFILVPSDRCVVYKGTS